MLKRRNLNSGLPLASHSGGADGSGRSIRMDAPAVRAVKNASGYTKGSYAWTFGSLAGIIWAIRHILFHAATIYINCKEMNECTLKINPPGGKSIYIPFVREQVIEASSIRVNINGDIPIPGMDEKEYESYTILFRESGEKESELEALERELEKNSVPPDLMKEMEQFGSAAMTDPDLRAKFEAQIEAHKQKISQELDKERQKKKQSKSMPSLEAMKDYAIDQGNGEYRLTIRKFNIGETRRRVGPLISRVNSYASGKRDRLLLRENRAISALGVVGIVFSVFSFLVSLLFGQFYETKYHPFKQNKTSSRKTTSYSGRPPPNNYSYVGYPPRRT